MINAANISTERADEIKRHLLSPIRLIVAKIGNDEDARQKGILANRVISRLSDYQSWYPNAPKIPSTITSDERQFFTVVIFWEWIARGLAIPRLLSNDFDRLSILLTPYGWQCITADDWERFPHDPDGYLAALDARTGGLDSIARSYIEESLTCFNTGTFKAAMVMLGAASERLVTILAKECVSASKTGGRIRDVFKSTRQAIGGISDPQFNQALAKEIRDDWATMLEAGFDIIRISRNQAGHPHLLSPITNMDARNRFLIFSVYCEVVYGLLGILARFPPQKKQPPTG